MSETVKELREKLREAEENDRREREARKLEVSPIFRYTLVPNAKETKREPLWDPDCSYYELRGEILNEQELREAGWSADEAGRRQGGMTFLFNHATGRFVTSMGGGNVYISAPGYSFAQGHPEVRRTWTLLSEFIEEFPDGGDVTEIVDRHRERVKQIEVREKAEEEARKAERQAERDEDMRFGS